MGGRYTKLSHLYNGKNKLSSPLQFRKIQVKTKTALRNAILTAPTLLGVSRSEETAVTGRSANITVVII